MITIALAGKGGSGKTTMAGLITDYLLQKGKKPVLAVDADPNSNLNEILGVKHNRTVISTVDEVMGEKEKLPAGITKKRYLEFHLQDALIESEGFDLLVMGRTEGPGCYCRANDLLRSFMEKLRENYQYIIMDNEAGMEHLSRRTTRNVDVLLIVANPTAVSLRSAERIYEMSRKLSLNIKKTYLVINEAGINLLAGNAKIDLPPTEGSAADGWKLAGKVPYDEELLKASINGSSIFNLPQTSLAKKAVSAIMENLGI